MIEAIRKHRAKLVRELKKNGLDPKMNGQSIALRYFDDLIKVVKKAQKGRHYLVNYTFIPSAGFGHIEGNCFYTMNDPTSGKVLMKEIKDYIRKEYNLHPERNIVLILSEIPYPYEFA